MTDTATFWGVPRRGLAILAVLAIVLIALPKFASDYIISVFVLIFFWAYLGQAWNIMMGFAGQLSLGHALYVGLGAYTSAALFVHFGLSPWLGMVAGIALAGAVGTAIGSLGFRFGVKGVYFALLTIAFSEFTRVLFDHFGWVGASGGLFIPVANRSFDDIWNLRGSPTLFYYLTLTLAVAALVLCHTLLRRRIGYYWQAIREDQDAAQALGINVFRYKVVAMALSSGMAAVAGVVQAFYYNALYPESTFAMGRSIELILGPIIGGLGTLIGPLLGAFVLGVLGEVLTLATASVKIDGLKLWFYGATLLAIVALRPDGIWPPLRRLLGFGPDRGGK